jgi:hypothetical protein
MFLGSAVGAASSVSKRKCFWTVNQDGVVNCIYTFPSENKSLIIGNSYMWKFVDGEDETIGLGM